MAKFVDTTWAACLARQKPVSTRANPACMKITRTAPMMIQSRFVCWVSAVTALPGSASWAPAGEASTAKATALSAAPVTSRRGLIADLHRPPRLGVRAIAVLPFLSTHAA